MLPDLKSYSALLTENKWISKIDFIFRLKSTVDCTEEAHRHFLEFLYRFHFSFIKRDAAGEILLH
jgi:hypothetical protein